MIAIALLASCAKSADRSTPSVEEVNPTLAASSQTPSKTLQSDAGVAFDTFQLPSKNIGCSIDDTTATCNILQFSYTPAEQPASCEEDYGDMFHLDVDGVAKLVCHGDTAFDPSSAPFLDYGTSNRVGSIVCTSAEAGLTCTDTKGGHGFEISRTRYRLF